MKKLNLGSGSKSNNGWIGVDIKEPADIVFDLREKRWLWEDDSIDAIASTHFFQELRWTEVMSSFRECHRILKPGGEMDVCVPDFQKMVDAYIKKSKNLFIAGQISFNAQWMWQLQWKGSYQSLYNEALLREKLEEVGFKTELVENANRDKESVTIRATK